ncbi:uncharacterized protein [Primulina huaijiensis]|uniref:uncharacterized protein isoform X2 n=1 Tax=Primulina huaijiensis TaxID=1492673 RepID=UPI003CC6F85C
MIICEVENYICRTTFPSARLNLIVGFDFRNGCYPEKQAFNCSVILLNTICQGRNILNVVVLPDERISNLHQYQPTPNIPDLETLNMIKGETCLNSEPNLLSHSRIKKDKVNNYSPGSLDADIEKGTTEIPNSNEESVGNMKSDDPLARILPTEICLQIGGKFMQFLVNHGPELPKFTSRERVHDTPSNRARKYKRSASFNSRRVLLLFSVLSSIGTIILIYLTLRVRQVGDRSGNV